MSAADLQSKLDEANFVSKYWAAARATTLEESTKAISVTDSVEVIQFLARTPIVHHEGAFRAGQFSERANAFVNASISSMHVACHVKFPYSAQYTLLVV